MTVPELKAALVTVKTPLTKHLIDDLRLVEPSLVDPAKMTMSELSAALGGARPKMGRLWAWATRVRRRSWCEKAPVSA